jgi:hypothetical protein
VAARAAGARERACSARARSAEYLQRGDLFFARVEDSLARTQELIAANAELLLNRRSRNMQPPGTLAERALASRRAERRALEFAAVHRDRGQMRRAQCQEMAAQWFAFIAEVNEDAAAEEEMRCLAERNGRSNAAVTAVGLLPRLGGPRNVTARRRASGRSLPLVPVSPASAAERPPPAFEQRSAS